MNMGDLLGAVMQSGMAPSSTDRLRHSLGGGGGSDSLAGMLGGSSGGDLGGALASMLGAVAAEGWAADSSGISWARWDVRSVGIRTSRWVGSGRSPAPCWAAEGDPWAGPSGAA